MQRPTNCIKILETISLIPKNGCQRSGNDYLVYVADTSTAVQLHYLIMDVLATITCKILVTILPPHTNTECQLSMNDF